MSSLTSLDEHSAGAYKVTVVAIILMVMQFTMGSGRLLSRRLQKTVLAADDYVLLFAILVGFGLCALAIVFPHVAAYGYQMKNVGGIRPLQQEAAGRVYTHKSFTKSPFADPLLESYCMDGALCRRRCLCEMCHSVTVLESVYNTYAYLHGTFIPGWYHCCCCRRRQLPGRHLLLSSS